MEKYGSFLHNKINFEKGYCIFNMKNRQHVIKEQKHCDSIKQKKKKKKKLKNGLNVLS